VKVIWPGLLLVLCVWTCAEDVAAQARRGVVIDERLSVLRVIPDPSSRLKQRLRPGRVVWINGTSRSTAGHLFLRVAVTQRTFGWILRESVAIRGVASDARRLIALIEETKDDFVRIRLATICADEYRSTPFAASALLLLGEAAERSAERLTVMVRRKLDTKGEMFLLNDAALDRFSRAGVRFNVHDSKLVYAGDAWREILRRYPGSVEATVARERLGM
jgi:hypothetical protein